VPNTRICVVSYRDYRGDGASVEVAANSVYEAAVLGLKSFRQRLEFATGAGAQEQVAGHAWQQALGRHEITRHTIDV
jgi:hypothetical protein